MATRTWRGTTSSAFSDPTNWLEGAAPTSADDVVFDNSATRYSITGSGSFSCKSFNTTGTSNAVNFNNGGNYLYFYGDLILKSGDYLKGAYVIFAGTATQATLAQNGATIAFFSTTGSLQLSFGGTGKLTLGSNLDIGNANNFHIVGGTLDTSANNYSINCKYFYDNDSGTAKTLKLNSSVINCTAVVFQNSANLNVDGNSHTINIYPITNIVNQFGNNESWGIINFYASYNSGINYNVQPNSNVFKQFNIYMNVDNRWHSVQFTTDISIAESSVWQGGGAGYDDPAYRPLICSSSGTTQRTVTFTQAGQTLTMTDVDLRDIAVSTTNSPTIAGTRIGDCGGNGAGLCSTPKTVYLVAPNTTLWMATVWATVSGGAVNINNYPLAQDTAIIDDNSFGALTYRVVTVNGSRIGNIDTSQLTPNSKYVRLSFYDTYYYGDIYASDALDTCEFGANSYNLVLDARVRGIQKLRFPAPFTAGNLNITSYGGTVRLDSDFKTLGTASYSNVVINRGNFDLNGYDVVCRAFSSSNSSPRAILDSVGTSKITVNGVTGTLFDFSTSSFLKWDTYFDGSGTGASGYVCGTSSTFYYVGQDRWTDTVNRTIHKIAFHLQPIGNLTGKTWRARIFESDGENNGTLIATSEQLTFADFKANDWNVFTFATPPTLTAGVYYNLCVYQEQTDASNYVNVTYLASTTNNGYLATISSTGGCNNTWTSTECCFRLYQHSGPTPDIILGDGLRTLTGDVTFGGSNLIYGNLTLRKHAGDFDYIITGNNTFEAITLETPDATYPYLDVQFPSGNTNCSSFVADGADGRLINIKPNPNSYFLDKGASANGYALTDSNANYYRGQKGWTDTVDRDIMRVDFHIYSIDGTGAGYNYTCKIFADDGSGNLGELLGTSNTITGVIVGWNAFTFSTPVLLSANTPYHIVVYSNTVDGTNHVNLGYLYTDTITGVQGAWNNLGANTTTVAAADHCIRLFEKCHLNDLSGTNNLTYCNIQNCHAIGGATWNALATNGNVDGGGNAGFVFVAQGGGVIIPIFMHHYFQLRG